MQNAINEIISNAILLRGAYFRAMQKPISQLLEGKGITLLVQKKEKERAAFDHPAIKSMLPKKAKAGEAEKKAVATASAYGDSNGAAEKPTEQRVAAIHIDDVMTKHGADCTLSTQKVKRQIHRAENDSEVVAILFVLDSPGGSVNGLRQLAMAARKASKPTVGFISETACSACFWFAQQCDHLMADTDAMCAIGSCGVIWVHYETSEADKRIGVKYTVLTDKNSTEKKLGNSLEPLKPEHKTKLEEKMQDIKEQFVSDILNGPRGKLIKDEQLMRTAKVLGNKKALEQGWIDAEGTFQDAVDKCFALATARQEAATAKKSGAKATQINSKTKTQNNITMKFPKLAAIFGGGANKDMNISFDNEEQAKQVEDQMNAYDNQISKLTAQLENANTASAKHKSDLEAAQERITELEAMDATTPTDSNDLEGFNPEGQGAAGAAEQEIGIIDL